MDQKLLGLDLRGLISALESQGKIHRIHREVDARFELAAVTHRIQSESNLPVVFERVQGTSFSVISNVYGNYSLVAQMLGTDAAGVVATWSRMMSESGAGGEELKEPAPEQTPEIVGVGLADLPHIVFREKDVGPYLTASMILAKDPDTGRENLSYHRMQMVDDSKLLVRLSPAGDLYRFQQKAELAGKPLEVAILIGTAPAMNIAGAAPIPADMSELMLADRIAGKPFARRQCATVDIAVPAHTEFVVEGEILPDVRESEGPFAEWMGYYTKVTKNHVLSVRKVSARKDALFHAILAGSTEELTLSGIPNAAIVYESVRAFDQNVMDVVCYPFLQFCILKIKKTYEGQPQKAMLGAMGAETNRMLYCVVVDEDVDIHNIMDVLWAMSTRCRVDTDIMQIPNVPSFARDPHQMHWGRLGIDATVPISCREDFERSFIPGSDKISLADYL